MLGCLIFLFFAAFCLLRQRRRDTRDLENELGSLEDRLSPVKRIRSNPTIQRHSQKMNGIRTKWPTTPPIVYKPTSATRLDATNPMKTPSLKPPHSLSDYLFAPAIFGGATTQTGHSEKTVSIYSTESAPSHFHDQLSNPLFMFMPNTPRASFLRGMKSPSNVTRDIGLFIRASQQPGTANLPSSSNIRLRGDTSGISNSHFDSGTVKSLYSCTTPIPQFARFGSLETQPPNQSQLLYRGVNLQALKRTASTSSFPPPLW